MQKKKKKLKIIAFFFSSKLVTSFFVLRQMFVQGLSIEDRSRVFSDFHNSLGLPMFSVNFILKVSIFFRLIISEYYISPQYKVIAYLNIRFSEPFEIFLASFYSLCNLIIKPFLCVVLYSNFFYWCNIIYCVSNLI